MVSPVTQSALSQMRNLAAEAAGSSSQNRRVDTSVGSGGFAEELQSSLVKVNQLQMDAHDKAMALQSGDTSLSLSEVMIDSQKASLAFETSVQVRNRLVSAYREIMNMQV